MKQLKIGLSICMVMLILSACAPQANSPTPTEPPSLILEPPTKSPQGMSPAETAAITLLSETLNLPADQITLISSEPVTWPDGCLGIVRMGVMCTQALVPGNRIVLEAQGQKYEIHTNEDGSIAKIAPGAANSSEVDALVIDQLSESLGIDEKDISVVGHSVVEFGDSCLGVALEDVLCAQVVTPGHSIVLEAGGRQYEYHTNEDGSRIQPSTLALTWKREGGLAGFCDQLTIFLSGEVYGTQCKADDGRMGTFAKLLDQNDIDQWDKWMTTYGQVTLDASDPKGVADGMTRIINFYGAGNDVPSQEVQDEIFLWAQDIYQRLYNQ